MAFATLYKSYLLACNSTLMNQIDDVRIRELAEKPNMSYNKIAKVLKVHRFTIRVYMKKNRISIRKPNKRSVGALNRKPPSTEKKQAASPLVADGSNFITYLMEQGTAARISIASLVDP